MTFKKRSAQSFALLVFGVLGLQSTAAFAFGPKKPEAPIAYPGEEDQNRSAARELWDPSHFTDPKNHDPDHFIYLMSEMDDSSHWTMDTLKNPDEVQGNYRICTSVIRNDFLDTFTGRIAFILDAPKENIGPMYWDDMASPIVKDYEGAVTLFAQYFRGRFNVFYTPNGLVDATQQHSQGYNEIDVMGTNDSQAPPSKVKIDGFIAHCGSDWEQLLNGKESQLYHASPAGSPDLLDQCLASYHHPDQVEALHKIGAIYPIVLMRKL